jgi:HEAT repeat protein
MTDRKFRSSEELGVHHRYWISPICLILLTISPLLATEQSTARAWSILEAGLHDTKTDNRVQAVSALGVMPGNKKAVEMAEHALQDPDLNVCRAAIAALGDMNSKKSLPKIKALISHSDAKTVMAIAAVLTKFNDPEGNEIYYELLTGKRKGGGSVLDGIKDRKAVEKMGVEAAIGFVPFGSIGTGAYDYFRRSGSARSSVDVTAVSALANDPDPVVEKALVQASLDGKGVVQVAALRALAKRGDSNVVKDIEPAMDSDKSLISYTAAASILHLQDLRAKPPLGHGRKRAQG